MAKQFLSPIKLAQGTSNPASGSAGEIFYNTTDKTIYTHDGTGWGTAESSLPAGTMVQWAGATAPANWLLCDGTAVSRTTYATLFAAIGTAYGVGDGSTTFNLPDLRGRVPVGKNGGSFGTLGATGGAETVTLTEAQMPSHTHIQNSHNHTQDAHSHAIYGSNGGSAGVSISITSNSNGDRAWYLPGGIAANTTATNQAATATNQNTGGGQAHNNLQPYQVVNYIIKATSGTTAGDSPLTARVSAIETTTVRSVALGGTGASTASSALTNLGAAPLVSPSFTGDVTSSGKFVSNASSGDEGGEIFLNKAATNTSISTGVTVDVYQNRLRFFEQGGSNRGYYLDITSGSNGAGTGISTVGHTHSATDITSGILDINRMPAGSVIQAQYYFNNTFNYYNTSSLTDVSSSLRLNFTPKLANSKMIIICAMNWLHEGTHRQVVRLLRGGATVGNDMWFSSAITYGWTTAVMNHMWEDSAAHTANTQITYSFQTATSGNNMYYNYSYDGQPGSSNYVILEVKT